MIEKQHDTDLTLDSLSDLFKSCFVQTSKTLFMQLPSPKIIILSNNNISQRPTMHKSDEENSYNNYQSNMSNLTQNIKNKIKNVLINDHNKNNRKYEMIYP